MEYLDFEIAIDASGGGEYLVSVLRSPVGEARQKTRFPFDEDQLKSRLATLHERLVRARGGREVIRKQQQPLESAQPAARDFGEVLFRVLFQDTIGQLYRESLQEARREPDRGLRIKLRTQAAELASLPWELLHDPRTNDFICLSRITPLVRYLESPNPPRPLTITHPLRVLGLIASPTNLPALDIQAEKARMEEAISDPRHSGLIEVTWLEGQTWQALTHAMGRGGGGPWHVFHFIGHGAYDPTTLEGHLALAGDKGGSYELSAMGLSRALGDHRTLQLAVLNACEGAVGSGSDLFSSTAGILVRRGFPAVVSMQYEVSDRAAIDFASAFYRTLANGYPVDVAVAEARKSMSFTQPRSIEWATPVLHMRSPDGRLFQLDGLGVSPSSVQTTPPSTKVDLSPVPSSPPEPDRWWSRALKRFNWKYAGPTVILLGILWLMVERRQLAPPPEARDLVVKLLSTSSDRFGPEIGAGIIVGADNQLVYIATARHVVRRDTVSSVFVSFASHPYDSIPAAVSDSTRPGLDVAVVTISRWSAPLAPDLPAFDRVGKVADLEFGDPVSSMGCPRGICWTVPVPPDRVAGVDREGIIFQSVFVNRGSSGGALFNQWWEVVGMVTHDQPPRAIAIRMDEVLDLIRAWGYPVSLHRSKVSRIRI